MMQINTVTAVLAFSAFALMHQSVPPAPRPPSPGLLEPGGGGGEGLGGWAQVELTDA